MFVPQNLSCFYLFAICPMFVPFLFPSFPAVSEVNRTFQLPILFPLLSYYLYLFWCFFLSICWLLLTLLPGSFKPPGHNPPNTHTLPPLFSSFAGDFGLHSDRLPWEFSLPQSFVTAPDAPHQRWEHRSLALGNVSRVCSLTSVGSLSRLTVGLKLGFLFKW